MGRFFTAALVFPIAIAVCFIPTLLINHYFELSEEALAGVALFSAIAGGVLGSLATPFAVSKYIEHEKLRKQNRRIYLPYGISVSGNWFGDSIQSALWGVFGTLAPIPIASIVSGTLMVIGCLSGGDVFTGLLVLLGFFVFLPTVNTVHWFCNLLFGDTLKRMQDNYDNAGSNIGWLERAMRNAQQEDNYYRRRRRKGFFGWTLTLLRVLFSPW